MRKRVGLLAGWLVLSLGSGVVAQEPSPEPPPWFGGRVEMPELGFSFTLPDDWVGFDMAVGTDEQMVDVIEALASRGHELSRADLRAAIARSDVMDDDTLVLVDATTMSSCSVATGRREGSPMSARELAEMLHASLAADPATVEILPIVEIDLPAGPGAHLSVTTDDPNRPYVSGPADIYVAGDGSWVMWMVCSAPTDPPDDDWLAIAKTIEFPPEPEPPTPAGMGGRVEVPEAGFALTLPDDWVWARHSELGLDELIERLGEVTDPGYAGWHRLLVSTVDETSPLIAWPRHGDGSCLVGAHQTDRSFEAVVSDAVTSIEGNDGRYPDGVVVTELALEDIDLVRLDYTAVDPDWPPPSEGTMYILVWGDMDYYIGCNGEEAPEDRWLSIAETIEFLPVEE